MATPTVMLLMGLLSTTICWFVSLVGVDSQRSIIADTCDSGGDEELMTCTKDLMQSMSSIDRLTVENIRNYYGGYPPECHLGKPPCSRCYYYFFMYLAPPSVVQWCGNGGGRRYPNLSSQIDLPRRERFMVYVFLLSV